MNITKNHSEFNFKNSRSFRINLLHPVWLWQLTEPRNTYSCPILWIHLTTRNPFH